MGEEEGYCAGAGVEVIDGVVGCELCELCHERIEPLGLWRVGLVEGLRTDREVQGTGVAIAGHGFLYAVLTGEYGGGEVGVGVVEFVVEDVLKGGDLRETVP